MVHKSFLVNFFIPMSCYSCNFCLQEEEELTEKEQNKLNMMKSAVVDSDDEDESKRY